MGSHSAPAATLRWRRAVTVAGLSGFGAIAITGSAFAGNAPDSSNDHDSGWSHGHDRQYDCGCDDHGRDGHRRGDDDTWRDHDQWRDDDHQWRDDDPWRDDDDDWRDHGRKSDDCGCPDHDGDHDGDHGRGWDRDSGWDRGGADHDDVTSSILN